MLHAFLLIVVGLAGDPEHGELFHKWGGTLAESAGHLGVPADHLVYLVLFGDRIIDEPGLIVPHPRFRQRGFVLQPLAEIAPSLVDPVTGQTVAELLRLVQG